MLRAMGWCGAIRHLTVVHLTIIVDLTIIDLTIVVDLAVVVGPAPAGPPDGAPAPLSMVWLQVDCSFLL